MTWNQHVRDSKGSVLRQLTIRVNGLKKLTNKADLRTKLMLANGIIMSKLSYGIAMWGNCQGYLKKALQIQQLTAARAVCGYSSYYWSTSKLLKKCGWLSVNQLYWQQVFITTYKIVLSGKPTNIHQKISGRHGHNTRATVNINMGAVGNLVKHSFIYAATSYNNLPVEIRAQKNIKSFKRLVTKWVSENIPVT